jgi:hypothetical protein
MADVVVAVAARAEGAAGTPRLVVAEAVLLKLVYAA